MNETEKKLVSCLDTKTTDFNLCTRPKVQFSDWFIKKNSKKHTRWLWNWEALFQVVCMHAYVLEKKPKMINSKYWLFHSYSIVVLSKRLSVPVVAECVLLTYAFLSHVEGWVFKSRSWQTYVVIIGSNSSTAKSSATGVNVMVS